MVAKDFLGLSKVRQGIAHNNGVQVRPLELEGASGIIPNVKINYTEVGQFCNCSKDVCRIAIEQIIRSIAEKVRKSENVQHEIPLIGRFIYRSNIAAVAFFPDLIEHTRG